MRIVQLAYGLSTLLPILGPSVVRLKDAVRRRTAEGTNSARYCYSVWLRHLVRASESGLDCNPKVIAELGPGDSLGTGLAALLSGASRYHALDVVEYANPGNNIRILHELAELFRRRASIPDHNEFPRVKPTLENYEFPAHVLNDARLRDAMSDERLNLIEGSLRNIERGVVTYKVPWSDPAVIEEHSVDMIYSQAVMEHVDDLSHAYHAMNLWLKPTGYVSHEIDFKSHQMTTGWNGHWACGDLTWKLLCGNRPFSINRMPLSAHVSLLKEQGFDIRLQEETRTESYIPRDRLAPSFQDISEDDLTTSSVFIQATKQTGTT